MAQDRCRERRGRDSAGQFSSYTLPDAPSFSKEGGGGERSSFVNTICYLGKSDSFAPAKGGTFAPPFLSLLRERKRRAAV